ncbi:flagellar basal body L-ring protein FlgH [candidate division KSB1 bacterium]
MKDIIYFLLFGLLLIVFVSQRADCQLRRSIYSDLKANKVGDVLTIVIDERTTSQNQSNTQTSKQNELSINSNAGTGFLDFLPGFGIDSDMENQYSGSGQVTSSGVFTSQISARITKVLESGNYLIRGTRILDVHGEKQITEITGEIRPHDLTSNNTILSSQISDIHVYFKGKGVIDQGQRPGLFARLINWIF